MLEKLEVPRIQFLDRLVDIPVGLRWRCTVHTVQRTVEFHRSSSLTCQLLCNGRGRLCSRMLGSTVDTSSASIWTNCTQFLREGGTQILKSILHPALSSLSGEVCTVDASVADELFRMEVRTFFPRAPCILQISQLSAGSAS